MKSLLEIIEAQRRAQREAQIRAQKIAQLEELKKENCMQVQVEL